MHQFLQRHKRAVLTGFIALWCACALLRLHEIRTHRPPDLFVRPFGGEGYPTVLAFTDSSAAGRGPFAVGDRLIRFGETDLEGAGQFRQSQVWHGAWWGRMAPLAVEIERGGARMTVSVSRRTEVPPRALQTFVTSLANAIAAIVILGRARPTPGASALFVGMATYATMFMSNSMAPAWLFAWVVALSAITALFAPVAFIFQSLGFPDEAGRLHGRHRRWPWLFLPLGMLWMSIVYGMPFTTEVGQRYGQPFSLLWIVAQITIYTLNYRASSPAGRRQVKWVVYLNYIAVLLVAIVALGTRSVTITEATPAWATLVTAIATLLFPASLIIAMLRSDLFDVDRILGATVSYNLLAVVVLGAGFAVVPALSEALGVRLGLDPATGRTVMTIVLAGVVIFAERRLRPYVERLFFKERFALEQVMRELPERFAAVRRADEMWSLMGDTLTTNLRPASCVIFLSTGEAFVPVYASGDAVAGALPARTPLVAWIDALAGATKVDGRTTGPGAEGRALLAGLGAQVVIPIHRGRALEAFLLLGEKRSGDIFTATDLTLLTSLAKTASSHMLRFDESELLERAQAMQARMRRYVPGAVAEAIALGDDLETGEREVSVLFVDIRGYTAFADGRQATDIFSTVNRYTEAVSAIVSRHGGVVVEFNGDGMMAVFGAPRPLPEKEASAVRAARELSAAVPQLAAGAESTTLTVGVGVATGIAFVGNIEAVDRTIWSAIGSTTNLAARLQTLTRDRGASVLVDATTWERAGDAARDFQRHAEVAIRGRKGSETLYGLPLIAIAAA